MRFHQDHRPFSRALATAFAIASVLLSVSIATAANSTSAQSPWLAIDKNRASIVAGIVDRFQEITLTRHGQPGVLREAVLRDALNKLRADHLFSASLAGTYAGLVTVLTEASALEPALSTKTNVKTANAAPEMAYTPVVPCRLADTRNAGGPIAGNSSRSFKVWVASGGFTAQGGDAGNCNVPANPGAVALNLTVVGPSGAGNLIAYPAGGAVPSTSALNYQPGTSVLANAAIVPACTPNCANHITIGTNGNGTQVVIDIVGYFTSPSGGNVYSVAPSGAQFTSIQAAIDAAHARVVASGGDEVFLVKVAPGVYVEQITLKDNVDVEGSGRDITGITLANASPTVITGAQSTMSKINVFNGFNPLAVAIGQTGNTPNGFTALEDMVLQAGGVGSNTAVNITGGTIHILRSDASTGVGSAATSQIALRGAGATTNIRYINGRLIPNAGGGAPLAASQESGAIVKIDNTELRATTSGAPLCFATFQQNFTLANCP